jgi:hypothetical protein
MNQEQGNTIVED